MATKALLFLTLFVFAQSLVAQDKHLLDSLYRKYHAETDPVKKIDVLFLIGNEKNNTSTPDEGFRYADSVEMLSHAAHYEAGLASAYDLRGWAFKSKGENAKALPWFRQEADIYSKTKDLTNLARAYNNIGGTWQDMQTNDSAIVYLLRGLEIKEKLGDKNDIASSLSNIANLYSDLKAHDKAIELLKRALKLRRETGEEKKTMYTLNNLAVAYGVKGEIDKAIAYADSGITVALKYKNDMVAGVICGGVGHLMNEQKRYEESIAWCQRSLDYLKEGNREARMVFPYCNMATAYIGLGQFVKGLELNQTGWSIMQKLKLQEPVDQYQINFSDAYAGLGDYQNAYQWHKNYFARIDTINKNDYLSKIANIEARYGLARKEKEISEQRAENFRQRVALYSLISIFLATVIFGYLFYNRYRLRKKAELDAAVIREQKLGLNAVIEAQEAERKRIGRDLHDGIAQELVAFKLGFDALGRRVGKVAPDAILRFQELGEQLNTTCTEVRSIAHVMLPPALEQHGLAPGLEMLLRHTEQNAGLSAKLNAHDLPARLDIKTEEGLYRITQELLNNVVKHARAAMVIVELFVKDDQLILKVEDDGTGFDFDAARSKEPWGCSIS
jgi:signal transduction histidine kinase